MPIDLVKENLNWFLAALYDLLLVLNEIEVCNFAND